MVLEMGLPSRSRPVLGEHAPGTPGGLAVPDADALRREVERLRVENRELREAEYRFRTLVERIKNLDIKHDGTYDSGGYVRRGMTASSDPRTSVGTPHPIVITHPVSGDKALYLGRRLNAYVVGLELAESERLLDEIWSCVEAAVYKHRWALGDLVLWDNRTTMHRRDAFDPAARRIMHRTQIKGSSAPRRASL